jgi:colicin import membrane protein
MPALAQKIQPEEAVHAHPVSALALIETVTAAEVFTERGLDSLIERIETEARTTALDISTAKGRKEIASLAAKIAKSKTALDRMGKELVSGWKDQAKKVDVERSRAWDRLEALQKEIRQPLTAWEDREKQRVADHEANIVTIAMLGNHAAANWQTMPVEEMNARLNKVLTDKTDWQEFSVRAKQEIESASNAIAAALIKRQAHDAEQAELARLRREEEERKQRAREDAIRAEAAEKARLAAELEAKQDAEAEAARVKAEQDNAEKERQRIQREKDEAEERARKAEEEKKSAVEKAERDRIAAAEKRSVTG